MSNLFESLHSAGAALGVYQRALEVIQNNVTNSMTPGFAKQRLQLVARPLDLASGLAGGVADRGLASARNEHAEDEVRQQLQMVGFDDAKVDVSGVVERLFDVSGKGGLSGGLTQLFNSFSAWSVAPSDANARASVLDAARLLAS